MHANHWPPRIGHHGTGIDLHTETSIPVWKKGKFFTKKQQEMYKNLIRLRIFTPSGWR
jgi:hypothetical protein